MRTSGDASLMDRSGAISLSSVDSELMSVCSLKLFFPVSKLELF